MLENGKDRERRDRTDECGDHNQPRIVSVNQMWQKVRHCCPRKRGRGVGMATGARWYLDVPTQP